MTKTKIVERLLSNEGFDQIRFKTKALADGFSIKVKCKAVKLHAYSMDANGFGANTKNPLIRVCIRIRQTRAAVDKPAPEFPMSF